MESAILTPKKTEYGKLIRKAYENGEVKESRRNMTELEPRTDGISNTITTVQKDNLLIEKKILGVAGTKVKQVGNLTESTTRDNPSRRRVYDTNGLSPTLQSAMGEGGNLQPLVVTERKLGNIYGFDGGNYAGNVYDDEMLSPTIRTYQGGNQQPMIVQTKPLGNLNGHKLRSGYAGSVYDVDGSSPTINTMGGGNREPMIVAMRGRNPDNPSGRTAGIQTEQRLELNSQGICNTLTSVQKDPLVLEIGERYGIRKLTPKECWRLMDFSDEDFHKAENANSNSQLYKQAGNSIVRNVLVAIFSQMIPGKENEYKEMD